MKFYLMKLGFIESANRVRFPRTHAQPWKNGLVHETGNDVRPLAFTEYVHDIGVVSMYNGLI